MLPIWIVTTAVVVLVLGAAYSVRSQFSDLPGLAPSGNQKPVLWWHVDDSQSNTKEWMSFEDRATKVPTEPYLALCLKKAQRLWSAEFDVKPLIGRRAVLAVLQEKGCVIPEGAERCPPQLWMAWCRCALLAHAGGLWLDGSVLPVGSGAEMQRRILAGPSALTFGADSDEELAAAEQNSTGPAAGASAGWSQGTGHPVWMGMARDIGAVIQKGDPSWSSFEARRSMRFLWNKHCSGTVAVDRAAEGSRDKYGRQLSYEDLFATKEWVNGSVERALWVPLPFGRDKLERTSAWLWFTRLSEEQLLASDFLWATWVKR